MKNKKRIRRLEKRCDFLEGRVRTLEGRLTDDAIRNAFLHLLTRSGLVPFTDAAFWGLSADQIRQWEEAKLKASS